MNGFRIMVHHSEKQEADRGRESENEKKRERKKITAKFDIFCFGFRLSKTTNRLKVAKNIQTHSHM